MIPLRVAAAVAFLAAVVAFLIRHSETSGVGSEPLVSRRAERRVEARLLLHRTDSVLAMDDETHSPVSIGFPRTRPLVAFLYRVDCAACQNIKPAWEQLADELAGRVDIMAATLDRGTAERRFLETRYVQHLTFDGSEKLTRAFGVWYVVPISIVIAPSGRVWWARVGPVDSASRAGLLAAVSEVMDGHR